MEITNLPKELDHLSERWLAEQWLLSAGLLPDSSTDTLLLYAYAQKGVRKVNLEVDQDTIHNGVHPKITYQIELEPWLLTKWKALKKIEAVKEPLLKKMGLLVAAKAGAPIGLEATVQHLAKQYLPPKFEVEVKVQE